MKNEAADDGLKHLVEWFFPREISRRKKRAGADRMLQMGAVMPYVMVFA